MKYSNIRLRKDQKGMVAIITTLILMIVISLMVLGFSQVARRNQRQALDAQLSSQAFYAAESGINLAKTVLKDPANAGYTKDSCGTDTKITNYNVGDNSNNVAITCLLVNPVNNLVFDNVGSSSKVSKIEAEGGGNIDSIFINWEAASGTEVDNCTSHPNLPPATGANKWSCTQPVLRIDLVPLPGTLNAADLRSQQYTVFLYPDGTSGSNTTTWATSAGTGNRGSILKTKCTSPVPTGQVHQCMMEIDVSGAPSRARFGVRMMSLYGSSNVQLHAKIGGNQPNLVGAQTLVDSTARANDVLKRVQARISTVNGDVVPDFAVMSDELCKRYRVDGSSATVEGGSPAADGCNL